MSIASFLHFVELRTKVCSIIPFVFGTLYALYRYHTFQWSSFLLMLVSLLAFDMATTAINNYVDFTTAYLKDGYGYKEGNAMGKFRLSPKVALTTIFALLIIGTVFGVVLAIRTDITVLLLGGICAVTGVMYTFGPLPISRTPFGELFSGVVMGFLITFIAVTVQAGSQLLSVQFSGALVTLSLNWQDCLAVLVLSLPLMAGISNILLANNICDMAEDKLNKRFTFPLWIGERRALIMFVVYYAAAYMGVLVAVVAGVLPPLFALTILSAILVGRTTIQFIKKHTKAETFVLSVRNFILIGIVNISVLAACLIVY